MNLGSFTGNVRLRAAGASDDEVFRQAVSAWEAGEAESVLPQIERTLATSRDFRLWHIHGLILRQLDRREDALRSLRRSVELNPRAPKPAFALAKTLFEAGLPSIEAHGRALQLAPNDPEVALSLASAFVAEGDPDAALT